jgi:RHS repeat-associated protein
VGEIAFQHSVSLDGAAQISIPIWAPPGRQGIQPSLALNYSSRGGNGPIGVGWSLSGLSMVTSCRRSPSLDESYGGTYPDRLCLDGARLVEVSHSLNPLPSWVVSKGYAPGEVVQWTGDEYRANQWTQPGMPPPSPQAAAWTIIGPAFATAEYRTETDSYRKVIGRWRPYVEPDWVSPDSLEVYAPDGSVLRYAARAGSHASLQGRERVCHWGSGIEDLRDEHGGCDTPWPTHGRAWMLDTVEDRFGNRMEIDYDPVEPLLPVEIRYTYHASAPNTKAIRFGYEPRTDIRRASMDGLAYTAAQRLKTIDVIGPLGLSEPPITSGVLRRYKLTYATHPITFQSMLKKVEECAGDGPSETCLLPLSFAYSEETSSAAVYVDKSLPLPPASVLALDGFRTADVNGDGFDDVLYRKAVGEWSYQLSDGVALGAERTTSIVPVVALDAELGTSFINLDRNQTVDALIPLGGVNYMVARGDLGGTLQESPLPSTIFTAGTGATGPSLSRVVAAGDFNGDGLPDLVVRHACREVRPRKSTINSSYMACRWGVALNQSTSYLIDFTDAMDFRWSAGSCTESVVGQGYSNCAEAQPGDPAFVLDVDGNGVNELIVPVRRGPNEERFRLPDYSMALRTLGLPIGTPTAVRSTGLSSRRMTRLFLDVNGDGLPDAVEIDGGQLSIAMNVGGTFEAPRAVPVSAAAAAVLSLPNELRVGDFNDDGLEDLYLVSARILLLSDGQLGFVERPLPILAGDDSCQISGCYARRRWDQTLDFNGDGLTDFLQMRGGTAHLWQRVGSPALLERITGGPLLPEVRFEYKPATGLHRLHTPSSCTYPQYCLCKGMWLVSEVAVKANVPEQAYPAGFNKTFYSYEGGRFDIRGRGWLGFEKRVVTDEQTGATITTTMDNETRQARTDNFAIYRYPGAFRPKQEVILIDSRTDRNGSGKIHRRTTDYEYRDRFDGGAATSALVETRETTEEAPAQGQTKGPFVPVASKRSTFDVNLYGLVTREISESFEGGFTSSNPPTIPPSGKVTRVELTRTPTPADTLNWLVRRYDRVAVVSTEPARDAVMASATEPARPATPMQIVTRTTDLGWKPGTATIERVTLAPDHATDPSLYQVMTLEHDPTGNVKLIHITANSGYAAVLAADPHPPSRTGTTTRTTRLDWDTLDQTLIRRRENPLQQAENFFHYAGLGKLFSVDDVNGLRTIMRRDRFGRARELDLPSSAGSRIDFELAPGARLLVTTTHATGEVERSFQDRWGNIVREESSRLHGRLAITTRTFNRLNQLRTQTLPVYDDDETPSESGSFEYDNLGRLVERSIGRKDPTPTPGVPLVRSRDISRDSESWEYDGLVTKHRNARGVRSTTTVDGAGRIVRSATIEPQTGREVVTRLEYAPFNTLQAVTGPTGLRVVNGYDVLGRKVSMTDPSFGDTTTGFNGYGEMVLFTDTVRSTSIERDLLGRANLQTHSSGGATRRASYVWDTAANGRGMLHEATSSDDIKTIYSYDKLGRTVRQERQIPGLAPTPISYTIETLYDAFGRPERLKYPAVGQRQLSLRYIYQPTGTLSKVIDDATEQPYWTLRKQDASGLALSEEFGDGTTTDRFLDVRKRLKMIATTQRAPGGVVVPQRLAYDYGAGGFVKSRHNVSQDRAFRTTEDFDYDFLGRLTQWRSYQNCQASAQEYVLDDLGNCTTLRVLSGVGRDATLKYGPSSTSPNTSPLAVRGFTEDNDTVEFQYDTAGRRESGGGETITWNEFDLPRRIQSGAADVTFQYDATRNRTVKQTGPLDTTVYAGGLYEHRQTLAGTTHVFNLVGPAGVFGQVSRKMAGSGAPADETWYFHPDALGTPDIASSDGSAGAVRRTRHEPFGQRRHASALAYPASLPSASSVGFTGHEADDDVGLINMRGRIYDPRTMRFLTPDPILQSPLFSQPLNRYAYVLNNPVNFSDPTGFQCAGGADTCIEKGPGGSGGGGGGSGSSGPIYSCASWNPFECLFRSLFGKGNANTGGGNDGGTRASPMAQQPPTTEDATRRGADAGSGWGVSSVGSSPVDWINVPGGYGVTMAPTVLAGDRVSFPINPEHFAGALIYGYSKSAVHRGHEWLPIESGEFQLFQEYLQHFPFATYSDYGRSKWGVAESSVSPVDFYNFGSGRAASSLLSREAQIAAKGIGTAEELGIPKFLAERQALHIPPVSDGRSFLTTNPTQLLEGLHNDLFTILRQPKPGQVVVDFGMPIGEYWSNGVRVGETNFGSVLFGKKGAHIIPANPNQW